MLVLSKEEHRSFVTKLKGMGWSMRAIRMCYPFLSTWIVARAESGATQPEVVTVELTNDELVELYDKVAEEADYKKLAKYLNIKEEQVAELGVLVSIYITMHDKGVTREQIYRMVAELNVGRSIRKVQTYTKISYLLCQRFAYEIYYVRAFSRVV